MTYVGVRHVDVLGLRTITIPEEDAELLFDRLEEIGFVHMDANYGCSAIYDGSWTITSLTATDGDEQVVQRCQVNVDNETGPLFELEHLIDEMTNSRQWVGLPDTVIEMTGGYYPGPDDAPCTPWPCSNYTLTIYRDGRVEYEGIQNVEDVGAQFGQISEADVHDLVDAVIASGFFKLPPDFHCQDVGFNATSTAVFLRTISNNVERCHSTVDPQSPLEPLRQLELQIAELVGLERWVGGVGEL